MKYVQDLKFEEYISKSSIETRILEIAQQLNKDFETKNPILLGILNGSFMFIAELFKNIEIDCEISFLKVSSYQNDSTSGKVKELIGLNSSLEGRNVIIVEDIVDTGHTLDFLIKRVQTENPSSVTTVTLLHKPEATIIKHQLQYVGFEIENAFVLGYGLDYNGHGRNSSAIYKKVD